jgi:LacI family transcriptional regulator
MGITSHDVARLAGVSQPTVSRALRDSPGVSFETRAKVREAAKALGYVPSQAGRSLSTQSTGRIGIVSAELGNPFFPALLEPLHQRLSAHGYRTILVTDRGEDPLEIETLIDGSLDGVILTTSTIDSDVPRELSRRGLPMVMLNRVVDGLKADTCTTDDEGGAALIADLFVDLGHTRIGALFGPANTSTGRDGAAGFTQQLVRRGVLLDPDLVRTGPFTSAFGAEGLRGLLEQPQTPTAVYCANDVIAIGALNAAAEMGVAVPADITLAGLDDIEMSAWPKLNLTTIHTDIAGMARAAADMIVARIADPSAPSVDHKETVSLVLRGTHGQPRASR